ncbi:DUF4352 domain-containing protein [Arthrobacter sp. zg-Y750]|uniref:DUF4352 domain-containing protein n=1 Tax=Arthrobacter sp. zg-Y750 TaxID=2894189 RepID=UPI001E65A0D8|nr:DUF4352 domain-containing protein [Arthrobacter sp. zg-Y750]MCC9178378.1 DUF4352 domain-containing protein [Arthrobacter sp. zg-Y750]
MENTAYTPNPPAGQPAPGQGAPGPGFGGPGFGAPGPGKPTNPEAGKGLAITALVIGIVSLLLCWVPFVNNLVFVLGLIGLGFAIPALVIAVKNRSRAKGMSIAALILVVLSLVGVLATQAYYGRVLDDVAESIEDGADGVVDTSDEEQEAAATDALAIGTAATVGDYSVTVTGVNTNAVDAIMAANEYNEAPAGQYVLVDLAVEYSGDSEGNPWIDLSTKFIGSDARQYDSTTCMATLPNPAYNVPTLEKGGAGTFQICMDVPAEALSDAKIFVQPTFTLSDNDRAYWKAQ